MLKIIRNILLIPILIFLSVTIFNQMLWVSQATIKAEQEYIEIQANSKDTIICILKTNKRKYKVGESPDIEVEIINKTDSTILMVGTLDGSAFGMRLPISRFLIKHPTFGNLGFSSLRCGNVDPLKELDFKKVAPNSSFNPYEKTEKHSFWQARNLEENNFLMPGIYQIKYEYSTKEKEEVLFKMKNFLQMDSSIKDWYFRNGNETIFYQKKREKEILDSLWSKVPKIELESNTITIEYNL